MRVGLLVLVAVFAVGAAVGTALGDSSPSPAATVTQQDAVGDSAGPDISLISAAVDGDKLNLSLTVANPGAVANGAVVQFHLRTPAGGLIMIIAYPSETDLMVLTSSGWETIHELPGGLINDTFSTAVSLSDLQSAIHQPVVPTLELTAQAYIWVNGQAQLVDQVPDSGSVLLQTEAPATTTAPTATTAPTTTATSPPPVTTPVPPQPEPAAAPQLEQKTAHLPHARLEWRQLAVTGVPAGAAVSIACTKLCALSEHLRVSHGTAHSKRFVGRAFPPGAAFVVRVHERDGTGWWFRSSVVHGPGGAAAVETRGCIASSGTLGRC